MFWLRFWASLVIDVVLIFFISLFIDGWAAIIVLSIIVLIATEFVIQEILPD